MRPDRPWFLIAAGDRLAQVRVTVHNHELHCIGRGRGSELVLGMSAYAHITRLPQNTSLR